MNLQVKLNCLLQAHAAMLQAAALPENLRSYSIQSQVDTLNKHILEISKQIVEAEPTKNDDDIPF